MPTQINIPDDLAAALDATPEAEAHGRNWSAAAMIARALGVEPPATPNERRRQKAAKHGAAGARARWGEKKSGGTGT